MMPHMARWLVGADHRWSLPVTLLATPALLLFADIIGRVIVPGELRVSVVSAFIGAPVLIFLVRRNGNGAYGAYGASGLFYTATRAESTTGKG